MSAGFAAMAVGVSRSARTSKRTVLMKPPEKGQGRGPLPWHQLVVDDVVNPRRQFARGLSRTADCGRNLALVGDRTHEGRSRPSALTLDERSSRVAGDVRRSLDVACI